MNDVSRIVSGEVLRTAQAAQHAAPRKAAPVQQAESRQLAPAKPVPPAAPGSGTPSRDTPRGSLLNILV